MIYDMPTTTLDLLSGMKDPMAVWPVRGWQSCRQARGGPLLRDQGVAARQGSNAFPVPGVWPEDY